MYMPIMATRAPGRDIRQGLTKRLCDVKHVFTDNVVVLVVGAGLKWFV